MLLWYYSRVVRLVTATTAIDAAGFGVNYLHMDILSKNRQTYEALAPQYEEKVTVRRDFNTAVVRRFASHITSGKEVLDIGCAVGLDMAIFASLGFTVAGLDIAPSMVKFAKKRNPEAEIYCMDFMEYQAERTFDAIFAQALIHLFPKGKVGDLLDKIYTSLNDGGTLFVTTSKSLESKEGWFEKSDYSGKHKRFRKFWTTEELQEFLGAHGFQPVDYYEITDPYQKTWMVFTLRKG